MSRTQSAISTPWFPLLLTVGGLLGSYVTHVLMRTPVEGLLIFAVSWVIGVVAGWLIIRKKKLYRFFE